MFEIRYSAGYGVDLAASRVELENLKNAIQDLITGDLSELSFDADEKIDPKPWDSVGQTLKIHRGGEAVRVSISNNSTLVVKGSDENLDNFATFLSFDEIAQRGEHVHFEFYEGNNYVAPDSIPLVISVK